MHLGVFVLDPNNPSIPTNPHSVLSARVQDLLAEDAVKAEKFRKAVEMAKSFKQVTKPTLAHAFTRDTIIQPCSSPVGIALREWCSHAASLQRIHLC